MSKSTEELVKDLESEDYDVLEDIDDGDYVFVVTNTGQLKGISFPVDLDSENEIDVNIEEIINFLAKKYTETRPAGTTLH